MIQMPPAVALLLQAVADAPTALWLEWGKAIMLFASTSLISWVAIALRRVEKRQVTHEHLLFGVDGANGLRSDVRKARERITAIEERNTRIDAVADYEKQHYQGEDRRMGSRRVRDVVRDVEEESGR